MIDPKLMYCTSCDDEYMPHMVNCGVCGEKLVSGKELLSVEQRRHSERKARKRKLTPNDDIVIIFKGDVSDVKRIERQLKSENITTLIAGEGPSSSCGKGCCGGSEVELLVHREDGPLALKIIEQDFDNLTCSSEDDLSVDHGFNPEAGEHSCPACGHTFATTSTTCPDCGLCFG